MLIAGRYNTDKSQAYLTRYASYFAPFREREVCVLELGVFHGGSLLMWRDFFVRGTIVGVDLNPVHIEGDSARIHFCQGSQDDAAFLEDVIRKHAPNGYDIIIDDASHLGHLSRTSFDLLFDRHLRPGGIYVVEDWGTGYWPTFPTPESPDGAALEPGKPHHSGMVGFVKELVDQVAWPDVARGNPSYMLPRTSVAGLHMFTGQVFVEKAT